MSLRDDLVAAANRDPPDTEHKAAVRRLQKLAVSPPGLTIGIEAGVDRSSDR